MASMIVHTAAVQDARPARSPAPGRGITRKKSTTRMSAAAGHRRSWPAAHPTHRPDDHRQQGSPRCPTSRDTRAPHSSGHQDRRAPTGSVPSRQRPGGRLGLIGVVDAGDVEQPPGDHHRSEHGQQDDDHEQPRRGRPPQLRLARNSRQHLRAPARRRAAAAPGDHAAYLPGRWSLVGRRGSSMPPSPSGRGPGRRRSATRFIRITMREKIDESPLQERQVRAR